MAERAAKALVVVVTGDGDDGPAAAEKRLERRLEVADRFEVYRSRPLALAVGDRIRVTAGGTTKDGKHRLSNGSL